MRLGTIWIDLIDFLVLKASIIFVQQKGEGNNDSKSKGTNGADDAGKGLLINGARFAQPYDRINGGLLVNQL